MTRTKKKRGREERPTYLEKRGPKKRKMVNRSKTVPGNPQEKIGGQRMQSLSAKEDEEFRKRKRDERVKKTHYSFNKIGRRNVSREGKSIAIPTRKKVYEKGFGGDMREMEKEQTSRFSKKTSGEIEKKKGGKDIKFPE